MASSAPRSHDALPSWLPQPKLNVGLRLAGAADNPMVASATLPPVAHAVTVHRAACPRWMLDCAVCTATQRLAGPAELVKATGLPLAGSAVADGLVVPDPVGVGDAVGVLACVGVAVWDEEELADVLRDFVVVVAGVFVAGVFAAAELDFADELAVGFAVAIPLLALGVTLADEEDVPGEGDGSLVGVGDAELCGFGGSLVEGSLVEAFGLAEALAEPLEADTVGVGVGVGVALGDAVAACSGSHCCAVPLAAAAVSVSPAACGADAASEKPVAAAARTPPVTKPAITGCTCVIRMRGPASAVRCGSETSACAVRPPLDTHR